MDNTEEQKNIDLEKLRDDKCFPIVQASFKEFPSTLLVEGEKQKELQLKMLSLMLHADLNIAEEVSYVSQSILGVIAGLNRTIQECEMIPTDDERYTAIGNKILEIVASDIGLITLGKVTPEESTNDFSLVKMKLNALFAEEKLTKLEVKYIMDSIFEQYTNLNNAISSSITSSTERMESKILGIESMSDLTLGKLNETLIS